jgi:diguanylate cyclase (GGDEF)-like protein/PAS domain S-box-containing protein
LPQEIISQVFRTLALPLIATNFVGIGILGLILLAERQRRDLQQALATREARYRLLAENSTDIVIHSDLDTTRRYVSPASFELLGFEPHELIGNRPHEEVHPDDVDELRGILSRITSGASKVGVTRQRHRHKDGRWIWTEATVRLVHDVTAQPTGYVAVIRDISERVRLEDRLLEQARTDGLTGLLNRRGFEERLDQEWHRALRANAPLALLALDVDHFKQFNDHFGHGAGDDCLKMVGQALRQDRRVSDIIGRLGGEEFALLLPDTDLRGAMVVAEAVRACLMALQIPHPGSSHGIVTASIGVAAMPSPPLLTQTDFLTAADQAMYQAKRAGRNRIVEADPFSAKRTAA